MRVLFCLVIALAAATPAHAEGGLFDVNPGLSIWTVVIFGIVLFILSRFAFPKILGAVEERERRMEEMLAQAERDRTEAMALVEQNRAELEQTRSRVSEALAEARTAGERLREELLAQARREQEEMLARSRQDIERQTEAALDQLRREAVELAIAGATRVVGRSLTSEDNRRLVRDFLGAAVEDGNAASSAVAAAAVSAGSDGGRR